MGAVFSAIGSAINTVVAAIANVIMAIVRGVTLVVVTIWDVIVDILCCRCFSPSRRRTGRRWRTAGAPVAV